jgi:hypothetical protein
MRLGAFGLNQPVPKLREPHALAILQPWVDVGNVGTLLLPHLESYFGARELGKLVRPGNFFDFTRYRPTVYFKEGRREVRIPNSTIRYARRPDGNDLLFLHLLEPHMLAEVYIDSILRVLKRLRVKTYCLLGSMYDAVPYTRPLLVTGAASNLELNSKLEIAKVIPSDYVGPTTIAFLISQEAPQMGIETLSLIVHLSQYLMLEDDYRGETRLMDVLCSLYSLPPALAQENANKAREQADWYRQVAESAIEQEPRFKVILEQLEANYDARVEQRKQETRLSPEVERFLQDLGKRFDQN